MNSQIEQELMNALHIKRVSKKMTRQEWLRLLIGQVPNIKDPEWLKLSSPLQLWYNDQVDTFKDPEAELGDFPDLIEEGAETAAEPEAVEAAPPKRGRKAAPPVQALDTSRKSAARAPTATPPTKAAANGKAAPQGRRVTAAPAAAANGRKPANGAPTKKQRESKLPNGQSAYSYIQAAYVKNPNASAEKIADHLQANGYGHTPAIVTSIRSQLKATVAVLVASGKMKHIEV